MPKQRFGSIRDKIKGKPSFLRRPVQTRPSPSHSLGIPLVLPEGSLIPASSGPVLEASPGPPPSPRPPVEPLSDSQRPGGTIDIFLDGTGPPQTAANLAEDIAYEVFKAFLDEGWICIPPMKAAAAGLRSVMMVIDVNDTSVVSIL